MKNGMNLAICVSGGGTTMREVLRACRSGQLSRVNPALIISSDPNAGAITKAKEEGFPEEDIAVFVRKEFETREAFGEAILSACRPRKVDLIVQCGWIPYTPENVIAEYSWRILNQHPGALDNERLGFGGEGMRGLAVHHATLYFAQRVGRSFRTEATVHRVAKEVDRGSVLGIVPVKIEKGDDAHKLAARVLPYEHALVINTIQAFSEFGNFLMEMRRERPLIRPGEEGLLEKAKAAGKAAFPNG